MSAVSLAAHAGFLPNMGSSLESFTMDEIFKELRSKDEAVRLRAAKLLRKHVVAVSRDITSPEQLSVYNNYINKRIFDLINSSNVREQLGGIEAINSMVDLITNSNEDPSVPQLGLTTTAEQNSNMITRYASYLRRLLSSNNLYVMKAATTTLGKLAIPGGSLTGDFVEFEVKRSLEWLVSEKVQGKRHAAVLILGSLAFNAPAMLYPYIKDILLNIWIGLRHPTLSLREDTAICLRYCLSIVYERDSELLNYWFTKLYNEALSIFKSVGTGVSTSAAAGVSSGTNNSSVINSNIYNSPPEFVHGSLLCYRELILQGTSILDPKIDEIYETLMTVKDNRSQDIRKEFAMIMPRLARYDRIRFVDKFMHRVLLYYISQLKIGKDRSFILTSVGDIAIEAKNNIVNYLDGVVLESIREGLSSRSPKTRKELSSPCFYCLAKLAIALGPPLTKFINSYHVLTLVLKCPITDSMLSVLKIFIDHLPSLEPIINDNLINTISYCLSGYEFKHPGAPDFKVLMDPQLAFRYRRHMLSREGGPSFQPPRSEVDVTSLAGLPNVSEYEDGDVVVILQALKALSFFDFRNYNLTDFVRHAVTYYISHNTPEVRLQASLTSSNIYMRSAICLERSAASLKAVNDVLSKLLTICITDPVPEVRLDVLKSLGDRFDAQLSQAENVRLLFMALNDELFEIRKATVKLVGRLTFINPAYIVPPLRKMLIQLLTTLNYAGQSTRRKEETAILISLLISSTGELSKPYLKSIMDALIPRATDSSTSVASAAIAAIGEMSIVSGAEMLEFVPQLMPILLETFQDQSLSYKRDAALKTLGQLAGASGYVIRPLIDYPQLLGLLVNILKSDSSPSARRETVRLMGILGALDPYKYREVERSGRDSQTVAEQNAPSIDMELLMKGKSPSNEDYFPTVVITTLLKILKDPSLSNHHPAVTQAIMHIFKTLGVKCVPYLDQVIPGFASVMHSCPKSMLITYFQQLGDLTKIVKLNIRPYLGQIFDLIKGFFKYSELQVTIIGVVEQVSKSLDDEFKLYVLDVVTMLLDLLNQDSSPKRAPSLRVLKAFMVFGDNMEPYAHLFVPQMVKLFEYAPLVLRQASIETVGKIARVINLSDYTSEIVHPLLRLLANSDNNELKNTVMMTICSLMIQVGQEFSIFVPVVSSVLIMNKLHYPLFDQLADKLLNGESLSSGLVVYPDDASLNNNNLEVEATPRKLPVNPQALRNAWDCSTKRTREDWHEWMRRLSIELLKESSSPALRACSSLATVFPPLAKGLFNCAFASCWNELHIQYQGELAQALCIALSSPNSSPEIHQTLLNLTEYLEHDEKSLPIRIQTLSQYAQRSHAYAKALHYKELEFIQEPSTPTIESLISINNQLQQTDAAIGILKYAQEHHGLQLKETWYEKLQRWDDALAAYNEREKEEPNSPEITMGKMRCFHALGQWEQLSDLAEKKWDASSSDMRRSIAPLAASASWGLGQWEKMGTYISVMKHESPDRAFFNAVLLLHNNNFEDAASQISKSRDLLVTEITALVSESYNRAYGVVVRVQMLAELEEIITYKKLPPGSEKRAHIRETWNKRLLGCQKNVDIWQRMLKVRALVVKPKQDMDIWIKFADLCRKGGRLGLSEKALNLLLDEGTPGQQTSRAPPQVVYAQLKYIWARGQKKEALNHLIDFTSKLSRDLGVDENEAINEPLPTEVVGASENIERYTKLLARCYLKQGEWKIAMNSKWGDNEASGILGSFLLATHFDPKWYKAWHNWALTNFEVIPSESKQLNNYDDNTQRRNESEADLNTVIHYVVPAVKGFFHSIALSQESPLQDTLRLLTLWLNFGGIKDVSNAMEEGFQMVKIDTWLDVIPQLISRIHQPDPVVSKFLLGLLSDLGKAHPQALVYPLTVAIKSESVSRQRAALTTIDKMRQHSARLVDQADLVSNELIRVSVLWHEMWYEGLDDASRAYFGEHNVEKMFSILTPLHKMIEKGPETIREASFVNSCGKDLADAQQWLDSFKKSRDVTYLNQAWDLYYAVFRKISRQLPQLQSLDLHHVSPKLLAVRNMELAVPGTYVAGKPVIRIARFESVFSVITSKQRPRKFCIIGSDGKKYQYVLKGHEDIRQDSLVMQLFGLVNTLLADDSECFKRHLDIQRFAAIPLSPSSGLLGWVPNADTFHVLIKEYREPRKIYLDVEHRIMLQMSPDYDSLMLLEKVEVFTYALDITRGQDLYKVLWFKSKSSEAWLDRRTTYTRSLAVMSMVGYILGLGDRHPSNLMMDRVTGKVVHIDFGDCFESAILREKYPEKVPFRLTRMLSYAMEVSGIEGSFRISSENVMRVLRDNKESLLAILEAFAYDPLINWGFDFPIREIIENSGRPIPSTNYNELLRSGQISEEEGKRMTIQYKNEIRNARAAFVLNRINDKLTGDDFKRFKDLDVPTQVDNLIQQATSVENLCQHYIGWCSFW
ncbi:hypothetical protein FOA43_003122 [Brettanomyces nanus]|uniref:Serine/threonine-protein kinase TOR n=1 Tax=Eeniella nana TaxID=13502 RepID=A0A875S706_EENNA|nr:uncharacterized protein FOA43_003122 [Brettanomyces nanus]QPG75762.1 hypothetical protein FOA43_003122 [Brettanomyces nanus]